MSNKPTVKQLAYLRVLTERTGRTYISPRTSRDASLEIRKLKAVRPDSHLERRIERHEIADAIAAGPSDSSRVSNHEITGWGSTAGWSQRS